MKDLEEYKYLSDSNKQNIKRYLKKVYIEQKREEDRKKIEESKIRVIRANFYLCFEDELEFNDLNYSTNIIVRVTEDEYIYEVESGHCEKLIFDEDEYDISVSYRIREEKYDEEKIKMMMRDKAVDFCYNRLKFVKKQLKKGKKYINKEFKDVLRNRKIKKILK